MADDDIWKKRFALYMGARLVGILTFFAGMAVAVTDLVRDGGWPLLGGIIALMGAIDALIAPKMLKAHWDREDGRQP